MGGQASSGTGASAPITNEQEALLGCGPFYGTDCDADGIDLFNAEASVLLQAFRSSKSRPGRDARFVNGQLLTLPGARGRTIHSTVRARRRLHERR
jgi:hypothetical protein